MKRTTPGIILMLVALLLSGFASTASAAASAERIETKTMSVHQGGTDDQRLGRRIVKVSALPDDSECGSWSHARRVVTYDSLDCAVGTYGARAKVRNDNGSFGRVRLVVNVVENTFIEPAKQLETSRPQLANNDEHPVRCDITRGEEVLEGKFFAELAVTGVYVPPGIDSIDYDCAYKDGASAGQGTVAVKHLRTGAYLADHPKMGENGKVTLGCNGTRNNVDGMCRIEGPKGFTTRIITVAPGDFDREDYNYPDLKGGTYVASVKDFNDEWVEVDELVVPDRFTSRIK